MSDLAGTKTLYYGFTGTIEPGSATRIASAFNHAVNSGYDEIYLCLSSTGGYIADGVFLYNHIMGLPAKVTIHNIGTVMSIATALYVSAQDRYCSPSMGCSCYIPQRCQRRNACKQINSSHL